MRRRVLISKLCLHFLMIFGVIVAFAPAFWMLTNSFKRRGEIFSWPIMLLPQSLYLENFSALLEDPYFLRYFINSAFVTGSFTLLALFFCSLAGFGFAKYEFAGKKALFSIMLGSLMIPFYVIIIPLFVQMHSFGWINTHLALILPFSAHPLGIFLMRQYMITVPTEILDAGRIDGCSEWMLYWKIMLPLSKPGLAACAVLLGLYSWNDFLWPLVVLRSQPLFTLPIGLALFIDRLLVPWGLIMAGAVAATVPVLVFYLFAQKHFMAGLTMGSVKD